MSGTVAKMSHLPHGAGQAGADTALVMSPESRLTTLDGSLSATIWRFRNRPSYELRRPADHHTHVIAVPISGQHHHTYFGNGSLKWSRAHPIFHLNIVVAGEQPRGLFTSDQPFSYLHVYVRHSMVERVAANSGLLDVARTVTLIDPMCSHDPVVEFVCRQIVREMSCSDRLSQKMLDALGQQLIARLLRRHSSLSVSGVLSPKASAGYRDWRLRRTIAHLEAHLADDLRPADLANAVGLSTARLTAIFREGTGEPPYRWLMDRRFTRACELLATSSLSITEIAHQCGFASSQHLATVMRRRHGITPSDYRNQALTPTVPNS